MAYNQRFGLEFLPLPDDPTDVIELNGKILTPEKAWEPEKQWRAALRHWNTLATEILTYAPWEHPKASSLDRPSLAGWISSQKATPDCKTAMYVQITAINGVIPAWQSLLMVFAMVKGGGLDKFWDETDTLHIKGGCQQLAEKLAQSLQRRRGRTLQRKQTVHAIRIGKTGVTVVVSDGTKHEADDVVLATPPIVGTRSR